jgi:DNA-binding NarL/FixJ family response regulator
MHTTCAPLAPIVMPAFTPTTVLLARFDDLLARGLRQVIDSDTSLEIVADDVEQDRLRVKLRAHRPRVAILDVDALSSLAEVRILSESYPDTRLVLLVSRETTAECVQALAFGASAFLGRDTQARDVLTAVHLASRGLQLIPRAVRESAPLPLRPSLLTRREAEVLPLLQLGSSNMEIAVALNVGVETIRTHARNIYRKLGVSSRRELAALPPRALLKNDEPPVARRRLATGHARQRRQGSLRR